jgi:hypothetical protein
VTFGSFGLVIGLLCAALTPYLPIDTFMSAPTSHGTSAYSSSGSSSASPSISEDGDSAEHDIRSPERACLAPGHCPIGEWLRPAVPLIRPRRP